MRYLKQYKTFEKHEDGLTLYHGGLEGGYDEETDKNQFNKFDKFRNNIAYFSDNPKFAIDYADTKSSDMGLDASIWLYTCKFSGNLFRYNSKEDMDKLIPLIPEKVNVRHGTAWFLDHDFDKEYMIKILQGINVIEPVDYIAKAKIDDLVPDPTYKSDKMLVINKDSDYVYTIMLKEYEDFLWSSAYGYNKHWSRYARYKDLFYEWRKAIVDWYNKQTESKYEVPNYSSFDNFYHTYSYSKKGYTIDYVNGRSNKELKASEEDIKNIDNIWIKCVENFDKAIRTDKDIFIKKWNINTIEEPATDFWNYYENETIMELIKKLGYDGYMAMEKKHRTYAIFEPHKTIEIIKRERVRN